MSDRILLVEDEANFGMVLRDFLTMHGFSVLLRNDGHAGWEAVMAEPFDLCILDVMMPRKDGFTLGREIKARFPSMPIIYLTARNLPEDVVRGLKLGADDYITKPFHSEELLLRIQAVLRRSQPVPTSLTPPTQETFPIGPFIFNSKFHLITHAGEEQRLSPKESELLRLLCLHQNDLLTRDEALKQLWGDDNYFNARSMDVFISRLRKRFASVPAIRIDNVHGKGFRLMVEHFV